jgi:ribosomal protein S18 acetylase RimI-like enzyme
MQIRFLTADDANEWLRLRLEALENDPGAFSSSVEEHHMLTPEGVRRRLGSAEEDSFVVGAFRDGSLVGTVGFYRDKGPKNRHKGRVWGVYLTPKERGAGIGRQMMERLIQHAAEIGGVEQILLAVTMAQKAARNLYRSLGFETFGTEPRALKIGQTYIDEEYMILRLKAAR